MPKVNLEQALLELDEARETHEQIANLLAFGTDDPKQVKALVEMMDQSYLEPLPDYLERDLWLDSLFALEAAEADLIDDEEFW